MIAGYISSGSMCHVCKAESEAFRENNEWMHVEGSPLHASSLRLFLFARVTSAEWKANDFRHYSAQIVLGWRMAS